MTYDPNNHRRPPPPRRRGTSPFDSAEDTVSHKFKVGQTVTYTSGAFDRGGASGVYKVTQLMPVEGDDHQYRIKSASEPHERVVKESQLDRVA
jgi:hypothetical protein